MSDPVQASMIKTGSGVFADLARSAVSKTRGRVQAGIFLCVCSLSAVPIASLSKAPLWIGLLVFVLAFIGGLYVAIIVARRAQDEEFAHLERLASMELQIRLLPVPTPQQSTSPPLLPPEQLRIVEHLYNSRVAIWTADSHLKVQWYNDTMARLLGLTAVSTVIGSPARAMVDLFAEQLVAPTLREQFRKRQREYEASFQLLRTNRAIHYVQDIFPIELRMDVHGEEGDAHALVHAEPIWRQTPTGKEFEGTIVFAIILNSSAADAHKSPPEDGYVCKTTAHLRLQAPSEKPYRRVVLRQPLSLPQDPSRRT